MILILAQPALSRKRGIYSHVRKTMGESLPPSLWRLAFLRKSKLVTRKEGRCAQKASAQLFRIADFGFRIFLVFFFNPHSAIGIPHLNCPPGPGNEARLMVFARNALASGPGNG